MRHRPRGALTNTAPRFAPRKTGSVARSHSIHSIRSELPIRSQSLVSFFWPPFEGSLGSLNSFARSPRYLLLVCNMFLARTVSRSIFTTLKGNRIAVTTGLPVRCAASRIWKPFSSQRVQPPGMSAFVPFSRYLKQNPNLRPLHHSAGRGRTILAGDLYSPVIQVPDKPWSCSVLVGSMGTQSCLLCNLTPELLSRMSFASTAIQPWPGLQSALNSPSHPIQLIADP